MDPARRLHPQQEHVRFAERRRRALARPSARVLGQLGGRVSPWRAVDDLELRFLDIPYGHVLLFTHTLMHGNRLNREKTARWSINVRFKGLFTPYSDKQLGDFFDPVSLRPATRIGMSYRLPSGFA